jgi:hypothetical protein
MARRARGTYTTACTLVTISEATLRIRNHVGAEATREAITTATEPADSVNSVQQTPRGLSGDKPSERLIGGL